MRSERWRLQLARYACSWNHWSYVLTEFESAFKAMRKEHADALITFPNNPMFLANQKLLVDLATKNRLPSVFPLRDFVDVGGRMFYGPDAVDLFRKAATYVDKILNGRKSGKWPVEQPTQFAFIINLKAAKQIGLTIPPNVLARVDRVIK